MSNNHSCWNQKKIKFIIYTSTMRFHDLHVLTPPSWPWPGCWKLPNTSYKRICDNIQNSRKCLHYKGMMQVFIFLLLYNTVYSCCCMTCIKGKLYSQTIINLYRFKPCHLEMLSIQNNEKKSCKTLPKQFLQEYWKWKAFISVCSSPTVSRRDQLLYIISVS